MKHIKFFFHALACELALTWDAKYAFHRHETVIGALMGWQPWGIDPDAGKEAKVKTRKAPRATDKLKATAMGMVKETVQTTEDGATVHDWEKATKASVERVMHLTNEDLAAMTNRGIDLTELATSKAECIKPLWAKGVSNSKIAAQLGEGFSERTVAKFTVAFSDAEKSVQLGANNP